MVFISHTKLNENEMKYLINMRLNESDAVYYPKQKAMQKTWDLKKLLEDCVLLLVSFGRSSYV